MEEGGNFNGSSNEITDELEFDEDIQNSEVFSELKQHCIQLLDLLHNPKKDGSSLSQLLRVLKRSPPHSLQPFMDFLTGDKDMGRQEGQVLGLEKVMSLRCYTLFPLLLLFDAAVNCRSSVKFDSRDNSLGANTLGMAQKVSDSVAEGVVFCLEEVLKKCYLGSLDQMVVVLKKLTHGAMLSPLEASEEFREGVIRCFRALLLNLCPCPDVSCPCKQTGDCPVIRAGKELQFLDTKLSKCNRVSGECLLAFLQSEPASAAIGHWLSLLLKACAADTEAARGHRGSPRLRIEALITLRVLVAKVGTVDALAFYLPGVVSQMGKILHASRSMVSGAVGSTEALDHAIRGLTEYLIIVLEDVASSSIPGVPPVDEISGIHARTEMPLASILDELRQLPLNNPEPNDDVSGSTENQSRGIVMSGRDNSVKSLGVKNGSLRVKRTSDWLASTTAHVSKLLSATYPHLCVHPSRKVRLGLLASVKALLSKCSYTLKESRLMLLECLCIFVCDDFDDVSSEACAFFRLLGQSKAKPLLKHDIAEVFSRLLEKLPQVILGNDESLALSHARKLLAVAYFGGPRLIADCVLISPVSAARFLDIFSLCFSQNSVYAGSLNNLAVARPSLSGFMHSISEIKAIISADDENSHFLGFQNRKNLHTSEPLMNEYELPRMPPWFVHEGSQKLYQILAGILRLVSLYTFSDSETEGSYSGLIDILMGHLRELISELRRKEHGKNSWQTWYRPGSGRLVRQASTAVCLLNELMFGLSDRALMSFGRMFGSSPQDKTKGQYEDELLESWVHKLHGKRVEKRTHLIDCIGGILHEYLSPEIWDLPLGPTASLEQSGENGDISLHFFSDNAMLHQVIIEGIGIFNICLGEQFSSSGFLHSSLYMLLENVICSNFQVKRAADAVLHAVSAMQNCPTVGHLVLANSDYIIDSVCRQLRHLDLNPHVPNVLSAMLSYVGVADKILPLLEEPMHSVSMELEILGRHHHPDLTLPFLKAVAEIAKSSKREANKLPNQAESFKKDISLKIADAEKREGMLYDRSELYANNPMDTEKMDIDEEVHLSGSAMQEEEWEKVIFKFNDSKRYRRIVGSIAGSCLIAVTPLITSADPAACLTTLSVIEDGVIVLAKVEEAYKRESETKEMIQQVVESCSFHSLMDTLGAAEDETQENRLLPAMNKIWPFLVACFRSKNLLAIRQCCRTIASVIQICGGDFFSRRFHTDGAHIWKHLISSPFQTRLPEKSPLKLPYRKSSQHAESPPAETSNIKVQAAILDMISDLARNKKSASSLEAVLKKVSGIVVGISCSGVKGLQDSCVNALVGLASIDPDLIWLLLADVYYSRKKNVPLPPSQELPELGEVLPPPGSSKEYLYVLYGGQTFGFDVDFSAVESVFDRLYARVFTSQMYK
ncbi:ARM repeat superfamily protein [Striga asiatica]|uniref:ARM repeat superfamily protein n=1 Tax=Striga asiatica TaxID=4170 RepID=A0A5A7PY72_STRAF|nr:ARM repeat superfamily protein [Striga asiatica]